MSPLLQRLLPQMTASLYLGLFAGLGAGWADYPVLVLAVSYVLPIALLPLVLHLMRRIGE
jgi:hypothetical protein